MKLKRWQVEYAGILMGLALVLYTARWLLFSTPPLHSEMWRFLLGDIAFLFLQVLLVTLVIDGMMRRREHDEMMTKLNMVIGAFFSEAGAKLLGLIATADVRIAEVRDDLTPNARWTSKDYERSRQVFRQHQPSIELTHCDLERLRATLEAERGFLIGLLGNQNLLEHEEFTDLLWALSHLGEELSARSDLANLPKADAAHVAGDIKRAYQLLGGEWISYLRHLQGQYPYLFSLAVRTNPLDPSAKVTVVE
ncbi:MAG TPA: hypothetical protein VFG89_01445 [Coriobacteriia bacterium]|nr:hypothetical protein [Coriobacteriia bacterium]